MSRLSHVLEAVYGSPWFILEDQLGVIDELVQLHVAGGRLSPEEIQARLEVAAAAQGPRGGGRLRGATAVIPIYGVIVPRATLMTEFSGGTSVAGITRAFREALADESVGSILFDVDSPGGMVDGIHELATEIREARGRKPMAAVAQYTMASAAYYLACQADEVVASPSSLVGSIGCFLVHRDTTAAEERLGITSTVVSAGKYKAEGAGPLTDEARAHLQERVDDYYGQFVDAVAKGRGVSSAAVRGGYGEGRALTAARAREAGLVDRVDTFEQTLSRLATGRIPAGRGVATAEAGPASVWSSSASWTESSWTTTSGPEADDVAAADEDTSREIELRRLKHRTRSRV